MSHKDPQKCLPLESSAFHKVRRTIKSSWIDPVESMFQEMDYLLVPCDSGGTLAADFTGRPIGGVNLTMMDKGWDVPVGICVIGKKGGEAE